MREASAFVPGHISGFFQVCDESDNPLRRGSRNCGICTGSGVVTTVELEEGDSDVETVINGRKSFAPTTETAVAEVLGELDEDFSVEVEHSVQAPIGAGYGMSGAGALGAVLSLVKALEISYDREDCLSVAHRAEVLCGSGLGDVGPQMQGGLVLGKEPGASPHGKLERIDLEMDYYVVCGTVGSISTTDFLEDEDSRKKSRELGWKALETFADDRSIKSFVRTSRKFARGLGIFDQEFVQIMDEISERTPLGASAAMLGKAIFAPVTPSERERVKNVFTDFFDEGSIMVPTVDFEGARILA